jgi:hypothetical protein
MKRDYLLASIVVACVSISQSAGAQTVPLDLIKQAVQAEGGAEALRNLKRMAIAADVQHWEPEQSYLTGGDARLLANSKLTIDWILKTAWREPNGIAI